jgi:hypothetical protein
MTRERPILFSDAMVRAILAGEKTQTRRLVKPQPSDTNWAAVPGYKHDVRLLECMHVDGYPVIGLRTEHVLQGRGGGAEWATCPFGAPGDRLWVRECFADATTRDVVTGAAGRVRAFRADGHNAPPVGRRWTPSIHMPRWASRLTLEVAGVRVARVQEISEADVAAEGITAEAVRALASGAAGNALRANAGGESGLRACLDAAPPHLLWKLAWTLINGAESWDANPWVWVVEFKRVEAQARAA